MATPSDPTVGAAPLDIRRVGYDHPDAVALTELAQAFYVQIYGGPDATPYTIAEFTPPHGDFLVGYLDGRPVAMGGWRFVDAAVEGARRPAEIKRMFVRDDHRRRGLARALLHAVERSASAAGADWMILETGAPQVEALALYTAHGFTPITPFGFYSGEPSARNLGKRLEAG